MLAHKTGQPHQTAANQIVPKFFLDPHLTECRWGTPILGISTLCEVTKCVDSISQWYFKNWLTVNASKCKMMILGTSARLKIASINDFNVMYEGNPLDLVDKN